MNTESLNRNLQKFWNDNFKNLKPEKLSVSDIKVNNELDKAIKFIGDNANQVLDIGTGSGYALFYAKVLGKKINYGLGIDTSINAIEYSKETARLSQITGLEFKVADHLYLESLPDLSYDGIICSNVLDVIPKDTSKAIIKEIKRLLIPNGYLLLKFNFYLTKAIIEKIKMQEIAENTFTLDGILRGVNYTTEQWLDNFKDFKVIKIAEYDRVKKGPKDRVVLLQKLGEDNGN